MSNDIAHGDGTQPAEHRARVLARQSDDPGMLIVVHMPAEALKAKKVAPHPGQLGFDFSAPAIPPEARGLHLEQRHVGGTHGHEQGFWVKPAEPPTPEAPPAPTVPASTPEAPPPLHTWPLEPPARNDIIAMRRWLEAAPEGAKIKAGGTSLVKHSAKANLWRVSGSKTAITSSALAEQLGPPLKANDDGEDTEWVRAARDPSPEDLAGPIVAEHPGEGHIEIADPSIAVEIPKAYMGRLMGNLEKLQARAEKLGIPPLTFSVGEPTIKVVTVGHPPDVLIRHVPVVTVLVRMPEIKMPGGWELVGTVEHGQHGNKIHLQRRPRGLNAIALRTRVNTCDHCHTVRDRKRTVILENEDGDFKHVGADCVKDYLGHDVPLSGWDSLHRDMIAELYGIADDAWGDGDVRRGSGVPTERFMETVAALIRRHGFKPRSNQRGDPGTADDAWEALVAKPIPGIEKRVIEPADKAHAATVLSWVRSIPPNVESDFLHNLRMSLAGESVTPRDTGMAAAAFSAWERAHKTRAPGAGNADGGYLGAVGDKIGTGKAHQHRPISGTVEQYTPIQGGAYGPTYLVKIRGDDGKLYTSFTSNPRYTNAEHVEDLDRYGLVPHPAPTARNTSGSAQPGDRVLITGGSVKKHDEYRGEKSTVLERMKYERTDIPDVSAARTGSQTGHFHQDHDLEFIEWARRHADAAGHKVGSKEHRDAMHAHLAAAARRWAADVGGHHYEGANGRAHSDREAGRDARPITEIARLNQQAEAAMREAEAHKAIIVYIPAEALKNAVAGRPGLHLDPVRHRWVNDLPPEQKAKVVGEAVRRSLSPDLLKQPYRQWVEQGAHPCTGHCYVASEAMYHLLGGKEAGYKPMNASLDGAPHWWIEGPTGRHDPTHEQFDGPFPYHTGAGKGFMSKNGPDGRQLPSKRAETVMGRALQHLDAGPDAFRHVG